MENVKNTHNKTYFNEFAIERIVSEKTKQYQLLEVEISEKVSKQKGILSDAEESLAFFDASSFGDQVHFQNSHLIPIQRWYPYREGYSIKLVDGFIRELSISANVFDPFSGSGTTLLASRMNDLKSYGIDINPISVLVAKVENEQYTEGELQDFSDEIENISILNKIARNYYIQFSLADKIFNKDILQSLLQFREHILRIKNEKIRNLFFVAWLSIIEGVSNIKKEGNGIKYKNRKRTNYGYIDIEKAVWEQNNFPMDKFSFVKERLANQLRVIYYDLQFNYGKNVNKPEVLQGNCLEFDKYFSNEFEFTFFSPPYCNCFDYFEIHKVELWLGNFINSYKDLKILRSHGLRSNTNALDSKEVVYKNEHIEKLIQLFDFENLWDKKIPSVVRGYFDDMHSLLGILYNRTSRKGFVGIVIGNSAYSGIIIPTDVIIANIAKELGFKVKNIFIARHLTTSSQQKKNLENLKEYLRESIVLLQK